MTMTRSRAGELAGTGSKQQPPFGRMGVLRAYVLKSLAQGAKSGYDLLGEIRQKTDGRWKPSKGALYPLITELEAQGSIRVAEKGARGLKKYALTKAGKVEFARMLESAQKMKEQHKVMGGLIADIFGGEKSEIYRLMFRIGSLLEKQGSGEGARRKARKALEECARKLEQA